MKYDKIVQLFTIISIIGSISCGIAYAGYFKSQMDTLASSVQDYSEAKTRLAILEIEVKDIKESVHRIEDYITQ